MIVLTPLLPFDFQDRQGIEKTASQRGGRRCPAKPGSSQSSGTVLHPFLTPLNMITIVTSPCDAHLKPTPANQLTRLSINKSLTRITSYDTCFSHYFIQLGDLFIEILWDAWLPQRILRGSLEMLEVPRRSWRYSQVSNSILKDSWRFLGFLGDSLLW